jgi:hypothetical protein
VIHLAGGRVVEPPTAREPHAQPEAGGQAVPADLSRGPAEAPSGPVVPATGAPAHVA